MLQQIYCNIYLRMLTFATDNKGGIIYYYYKLQQIYCNIYLRPLTLVLQHIMKGGLIIISITCCNRSTISSTVLFENVATYTSNEHLFAWSHDICLINKTRKKMRKT